MVSRPVVLLVVVPSGFTKLSEGQGVVVHRRVLEPPGVFLLFHDRVFASCCTTVTFLVRMCFPAEVASAPSHVRRFRFRTLGHVVL